MEANTHDVRTLDVRHDFTPDELADLARAVARDVAALDRIDAERKASAAEFKAQATTVSARLRENARAHALGHEYRPERCRLRRDRGRSVRQWVSEQTGEVIREEPFTEADYQTGLFGDGDDD